MKLFDGKKEAEILEEKIKEHLKRAPSEKKLLIIQIGDNAPSEKYIGLKHKLAEKLGIKTEIVKLEEQLSDEQITYRVKELFADEMVGGGIIQLPLPREGIQNVLDLIPFDKDIDGLSGKKIEQILEKNADFMSPTLRAFQHFLTAVSINTPNLTVGVVGAGDLVGSPITQYLLSQEAKVTVLDAQEIFNSIFSDRIRQNSNLNYGGLYEKGKKLDFDLLILSAGVPNMISGADIKEGCHVVDFGSSVINGKTVGDMDMNSTISHLGYISPSPGGMGPLVVRYLMMNFLGI